MGELLQSLKAIVARRKLGRPRAQRSHPRGVGGACSDLQAPRTFARDDLEAPVTREFCGRCGTHLATRRPGLEAVILKIGMLDEPAPYRGPKMAIFTVDKQDFHHLPDGLPAFERLPG
ncbi:GFA family protein [Caulobacter sp. 17J80-11]|nr:GFA family protein [Caulobacter sp. 17J80-11]